MVWCTLDKALTSRCTWASHSFNATAQRKDSSANALMCDLLIHTTAPSSGGRGSRTSCWTKRATYELSLTSGGSKVARQGKCLPVRSEHDFGRSLTIACVTSIALSNGVAMSKASEMCGVREV